MATTMRSGLSYEAERALRTIFKRCVNCLPETPTCPDCPSGQICSFVPRDCNFCQRMDCIANPSPAPVTHSVNVGAIAGGVIGGLAFMAVLIFIFWRFWIKKLRERQELEAEEWAEDDIAQQKHGQLRIMRPDTASTRTRGSIANSILSRASNIIHIAYIPGVTNRGGSGNNSLLVTTPVPPIPAAYANQANQTPRSPLSNEGDALFFRPGSLRGSTYSDGSSIRSTNRDTKYSLTPSLARSSMMSDVYRDDATAEPMPIMPATQALRALPRMVSVKHSAASSPSESMDPGSFPNPAKLLIPGQSTTSSPSSSLHNGAGPSFAKATQVTVGKGKGKGRFPIARQISDGSTSTSSSSKYMPAMSSPLVDTVESDEEDEHARARQSLVAATVRAAHPSPLIQPYESPFFDASELQLESSPSTTMQSNTNTETSSSVLTEIPLHSNVGLGGLGAIREEMVNPASQNPRYASGNGESSPFSDAHATQP